MKSQLLSLLVICLFASQLKADEAVRVVLHVNDGFKLGHLEKSVENIRKEMGQDADIRVVINGKAVQRMLRSNRESSRIVRSILNSNVPIGLCHNAVNNNRVDKNLLIKGLDILPTDGNVTIIKYQQQGYLYIKL